LVGERRFTKAPLEDANRPFTLGRDSVRTVVTFHLVCLAWVFFRASSFTLAFHYLSGIATLRSGPVDKDALTTLALAAVAMFTIDCAQRRARDHAAILDWAPALRGLAYGAMILGIIIFSGGTPVPFIYFRF
jgi:hypothetical protein